MRKKSDKWKIASQMPPLHHTLPGQEFNIAKSEVVKWLCSNPEIMQLVFNAVREEYIAYNPETGEWRGVEYDN